MAASSCSDCDATKGFVNNQVEQSVCQFCGSGKKAVAGTTNDCVECEASKYSTGGTDFCALCTQAGTYSTAGSAFCSTAGAGTVANGNRTGFETCQKNTISIGASDQCTECDGGHSGVGASVCVDTPPGHFFDGTTDQPCVAGRFSANGASSETGCFECVNGKYSSPGSAYCSTVEAGKRVTKVGGLRVNVTACLANTFSTGANDTCSFCTGGHSKSGSSSCTDTPPGHYFDDISNADRPCPASTFSKDGANSLSDCSPCDFEGSYSGPGASFCSFSPAGYRPKLNRTGIEICPVGSISGIGQDSCSLFEFGKF